MLWDGGSGGDERPAYGIQEWGKVEGTDERERDVLLKGRAGESGKDMEGAREGDSGRTGSGRIRAALRKDRENNKACGGGNTVVGDLERRKVGVAGIYGVREV